jgi:hypothetical protein
MSYLSGPQWDLVRDDPRFQALLQRMKLPQQRDTTATHMTRADAESRHSFMVRSQMSASVARLV